MTAEIKASSELPAAEELHYIRVNCLQYQPHYPVPAASVEWLLSKYALVPGAIQPLPVRKFVAKAFADLDEVMTLTMIYREVEGANTCGLPTLMVPASWVVWLLAEYDRKSSAPKVKEIYERTQNGTLLSRRDFEITTCAVNAMLSQSGWEEFDELYKNVLSGEYLDPKSSKFPWLHGIRHLTHDEAGFVYWKGQKVGYSPVGREYAPREVARVRQLAIDCVMAESTGAPLPCVTESQLAA